MANWNGPLEPIDDNRVRIPRSYNPKMRVDGIIYADSTLLKDIRADQAPEQVANVATLPGIVCQSMAMPDIHWGYGFPIGGVAAFTMDEIVGRAVPDSMRRLTRISTPSPPAVGRSITLPE